MATLFEKLAHGRPPQEPTPTAQFPWPQACCSVGFKPNGPSPSSAREIFNALDPTPSGTGKARSKWPKPWSEAAGSSP